MKITSATALVLSTLILATPALAVDPDKQKADAKADRKDAREARNAEIRDAAAKAGREAEKRGDGPAMRENAQKMGDAMTDRTTDPDPG